MLFFTWGREKRVWYIDDRISVQTSTQSRVGDDWCQQQLLKCVNFMSVHRLWMIEYLVPRTHPSHMWSWKMEFQQALPLDLLKSRFILKRMMTQIIKRACTISFWHYNSASGDPSSRLRISWSLLATQKVNTFKKLLLTPMITRPRLGGSLNRNCIVDVPDPFFPHPCKRKKQSGYVRLWYSRNSVNVLEFSHVFCLLGSFHTCWWIHAW